MESGRPGTVALAIALQELEVDRPVGIRFEDQPPRVAALGDMVGDVDGDHTREASHQS
jgi:hypothetical protein